MGEIKFDEAWLEISQEVSALDCAREEMQARISEQIERKARAVMTETFFGSSTTATAEPESLTVEKLKEALGKFRAAGGDMWLGEMKMEPDENPNKFTYHMTQNLHIRRPEGYVVMGGFGDTLPNARDRNKDRTGFGEF